ncbi:protein MAIN-LIKE 2-like [Lotus japonicus]|uniref:protein MAIN-LIKE 2-like n=1 Tax=Lotus japonicus TaxID=34305 RepID=UPI0025898720|nr:protein MAIN-LIKE 2-like [Lotus japonicus]
MVRTRTTILKQQVMAFSKWRVETMFPILEIQTNFRQIICQVIGFMRGVLEDMTRTKNLNVPPANERRIPPPTASVRKAREVAALQKKEEARKRRDEATRKKRAGSATTAASAVQEPEPEQVHEPDDDMVDAEQSFKQHISLEVWKHYKKPAEVLDRGVLKTYHHGNAMLGNDKEKHNDVKKCFSTYVKGRVEAAGLLPLLTCNLPSVDKTMLTAFVERWQPETSSFHMSFGEMTITLDDVSSLLHIPVKGKFFTLPVLTREDASSALHKQLGVTQADAEEEIRKTLGPYARYTWLLKVAEDMAKEEKTKKAARAFLLRLVGMTIFCGKTNNKVYVAYLGMFMDLEKVGEYAWGAMTLAFLYDQLKDATKVGTTSLGGYLNLFQAWIFEHFPASLFDRNLNRIYSEKDPRACKWVTKRGTVDLHAKRLILDDLRDNNVIWTPYDGHRVD